MKRESFVIPTITISVISVLLLISDLTSYSRGKKSFLLGTRDNKKAEMSKSLNNMSNQILGLTSRVSRLEEHLKKIDSKFKDELIIPHRDQMKRHSTTQHLLPEIKHRSRHYYNKKYPFSIRKLDDNQDSESSSTTEQTKAFGKSRNSYNYQHSGANKKHYNDQSHETSSTTSSSFVTHNSNALKINNENFDRHEDNDKEPFIKSSIFESHKHLADQAKEKENNALDKLILPGKDSFSKNNYLETFSANPKINRNRAATISKIKFPKDISIRNQSNEVKEKEDIAKKNPFFDAKDSDLIEIKKFSDLNSFIKFTKNKGKIRSEDNNDKTETSFYKVSDVLKGDFKQLFDPNIEGNGSVAKGLTFNNKEINDLNAQDEVATDLINQDQTIKPNLIIKNIAIPNEKNVLDTTENPIPKVLEQESGTDPNPEVQKSQKAKKSSANELNDIESPQKDLVIAQTPLSQALKNFILNPNEKFEFEKGLEEYDAPADKSKLEKLEKNSLQNENEIAELHDIFADKQPLMYTKVEKEDPKPTQDIAISKKNSSPDYNLKSNAEELNNNDDAIIKDTYILKKNLKSTSNPLKFNPSMLQRPTDQSLAY